MSEKKPIKSSKDDISKDNNLEDNKLSTQNLPDQLEESYLEEVKSQDSEKTNTKEIDEADLDKGEEKILKESDVPVDKNSAGSNEAIATEFGQIEAEPKIKSEEGQTSKETSNNQSTLSTLGSVIANTLFSIFLILIIGIIALNALTFARGEDISIFGKTMYIVGEDTMEPILSLNDGIIIDKKPSNQVKDGDLVAYETISGEVVTAWIIEIYEDDKFEIKKDINSNDSMLIDGIAIIGVATTSIANMGDYMDFLTNPVSILVLLVVGIAIYIVVWLISQKRYKRS